MDILIIPKKRDDYHVQKPLMDKLDNYKENPSGALYFMLWAYMVAATELYGFRYDDEDFHKIKSSLPWRAYLIKFLDFSKERKDRLRHLTDHAKLKYQESMCRASWRIWQCLVQPECTMVTSQMVGDYMLGHVRKQREELKKAA